MEQFYRCAECGELNPPNFGRYIIIKGYGDCSIRSAEGEVLKVIESGDEVIWACYACRPSDESTVDKNLKK